MSGGTFWNSPMVASTTPWAPDAQELLDAWEALKERPVLHLFRSESPTAMCEGCGMLARDHSGWTPANAYRSL